MTAPHLGLLRQTAAHPSLPCQLVASSKSSRGSYSSASASVPACRPCSLLQACCVWVACCPRAAKCSTPPACRTRSRQGSAYTWCRACAAHMPPCTAHAACCWAAAACMQGTAKPSHTLLCDKRHPCTPASTQLARHLTADEMRMVLPRRALKPRTFRIGAGQVRSFIIGAAGWCLLLDGLGLPLYTHHGAGARPASMCLPSALRTHRCNLPLPSCLLPAWLIRR